MDVGDKKSGRRSPLLERLHNPGQLRVLVTVLMVVAGYAGIYLPLNGETTEATQELAGERQRLELAREVEQLRAQHQRFRGRLPEKSDPNEWVQYVLAGTRGLPVKLTTLDAAPPRDVGPYRAVVLKIELEGAFADLNAFLGWLETNERLFRVDAVTIEPSRHAGGALVMHLTVLGVMG